MDEDFELGVYDPRFLDPIAAADYLESLRWPNGPVCPHCGESERTRIALVGAEGKRLTYRQTAIAP